MNRRERRAAQGQASAQNAVMAMFTRALDHHRAGELGPAASLYKKVLTAVPDHAAACYRLADLYVAQHKLDKAAAQYAELARIAPQTLAMFSEVLAILRVVAPALAAQLDNKNSEPDIAAKSGTIETIIDNPYFQIVLQSMPVYDSALERWLTILRRSILRVATSDQVDADDDTITFCATLARQCFINEYVWAVSSDELERVNLLKGRLADRLSGSAQIAPLTLLALAMYVPLGELEFADQLVARQWPASVDTVIRQQIAEPREERVLRDTIRRLTPISEGVTAEVRQQYEENPYPRWAVLAAPPWPLISLDDHLRARFPSAPFRPVERGGDLEVLVVGCGTGRHALEIAQTYRGARVLAVDLSLSSLASAKRRTPLRLANAIEFAQADIMALGSLDRTFDLINSGGVFHHMPDPWAGWREVLKLMKPNGVMQVGLYSAHARRDILTARRIIAERGYPPTPDDILRLRHDLTTSGEKFSFMTLDDYFTVSTCRDLLFHVHEVQTTIPEIKAFLDANGLRFIGFDFGAQEGQEHYRNLFARNGWSLSDLDRWDAFERENPQLFAGMYVFWVQKA